MPELPEVETVRLSLQSLALGRAIVRVTIRRPQVVRGDVTLLRRGGRIVQLLRHGKQLAFVYDDGRCVCAHLGMTGSLTVRSQSRSQKHDHVVWHFDAGVTSGGGGAMVFRDPRRFGGLWVFDDEQQMRQARWAKLGPDALAISARHLHAGLSKRSCAIKAALLDQTLLAGVGNIYADEALFASSIHPTTPGRDLTLQQVQTLVRHLRRIMRRAIAFRGSSKHTFVDADGKKGNYQNKHKVYDRGGKRCVKCKQTLDRFTCGGRTTVACPRCQPLPASTSLRSS
ncbi:MAG: bifunctional DNA-formamidopyrimidine glycosylase/DNA-(apurinic or apyrimidinic site) lyase [Phycisphaeraceae bacterium]|nr:bifunctional DNA-formamidopyrimidine glycosylase/DNA-(apurinic or apyrimidinic site) lyase [Phycisphaeraceae bacterium]